MCRQRGRSASPLETTEIPTRACHGDERVARSYESASGGGHPSWKLTARERQVLTLVAAGYANREIADQFAVSQETVKHCVTRLFAKLGASNRLELAMAANQHAAMLAPESLPS